MSQALDRILRTPLKATERGGMSSVRVSADNFHVATINAGMNDQPEYARLFAAAPALYDVCVSFSVIERDGKVVLRIAAHDVAAVAGNTTEAMVLRQFGANRKAAIAKAKKGTPL